MRAALSVDAIKALLQEEYNGKGVVSLG